MVFNSIEEVIDEMDSLLARWEPLNDHRAVFIRSYRIITLKMQSAILTEQFEDNAWMEVLDIAFAQEYFDALTAWDSNESLPECWRLTFELAEQKRSSVMQDLILGMIAHIVNDLPIALAKAGLEPQHRAVRLRDHQKSNDILAELIDDIQNEISSHYSMFLGFLDNFSGGHDELLTDKGIRLARTQAWTEGIRLSEAQSPQIGASITAKLDLNATAMVGTLIPKRSMLNRFSLFFRGLDRDLARLFN